jgi:thioredoxin reductase (NADPH)
MGLGCSDPPGRGFRDPRHRRERLSGSIKYYVAGALVAGSDGNRIFIENGRFHGTTIVKAILAGVEARS